MYPPQRFAAKVLRLRLTPLLRVLNKGNIMNKLAFVMLLGVLAGCETMTPNYDAKFGESVPISDFTPPL